MTALVPHVVLIPGVQREYICYACDRASAIAEAASYHGLTKCPPGTVAIPFEQPALPLAA